LKRILNTKLLAVWMTVVVAAGVLCACGGSSGAAQSSAETQQAETEKAETEKAEQPAAGSGSAVGSGPVAVISIKDHGKITVQLDEENAPLTTANFVKLAGEGFYDGLTFHRIIEGFMMQGGDPNGNGTGGSSETIKGEFASNGVDNPLSHTRGAISMARAADPDSASSQFFIVHKDSTFLDGDYAVFGYVTEGMDIVDQICEEAQPVDGNGSIAPEAQPVIESITIQ
jgi:peptidyl-prolyl cis-trans isomerase B (cyclophilin B)